jgi:hypothetical protein
VRPSKSAWNLYVLPSSVVPPRYTTSVTQLQAGCITQLSVMIEIKLSHLILHEAYHFFSVQKLGATPLSDGRRTESHS